MKEKCDEKFEREREKNGLKSEREYSKGDGVTKVKLRLSLSLSLLSIYLSISRLLWCSLSEDNPYSLSVVLILEFS